MQTQGNVTQQTERAYVEDSMASSPGHYTAGDDQTADAFTRDDAGTMRGHDGDDDDEVQLLDDDDSLLQSLDLATGGAIQSTPKPSRHRVGTGKAPTEWVDMESPFEALEKELTGKDYGQGSSPPAPTPPRAAHHQQQQHRHRYHFEDSSSALLPPSTPRTLRGPSARLHHRDDGDDSPESAPLRAPPPARTPGLNEDPIRHRVLDKTWRLQATPLGKPAPSRYRFAAGASTADPPTQPLFPSKPAAAFDDSSPFSSPVEPQLRTQIFTPRALRTPGAERFAAAAAAAVATAGTAGGGTTAKRRPMYDDDSDDDLLLPAGFSPPKTMQFALPPSMLMATPAREASRRIVEDIMQTAGAGPDGTMTTTTTDQGSSPPRRRRVFDDDDGDDDPF